MGALAIACNNDQYPLQPGLEMLSRLDWHPAGLQPVKQECLDTFRCLIQLIEAHNNELMGLAGLGS
jgi:hypothetical protein